MHPGKIPHLTGALLPAALIALLLQAAPSRAQVLEELTFHHRGGGLVRVTLATTLGGDAEQFVLPAGSTKTVALARPADIRIAVRHGAGTETAAADAAEDDEGLEDAAPALIGRVMSLTDLLVQAAAQSRVSEGGEAGDEDAVIPRPAAARTSAFAVGGLDVRVRASAVADTGAGERMRALTAARYRRARAILDEEAARADIASLNLARATEEAYLAQAEARLADATRAPDEGGAFSEDMKTGRITTRELKLRSVAGRNAWTDYRAGRISSIELMRRWRDAGEETASLYLKDRDAEAREAARQAAQGLREMARRKIDRTRSLLAAREEERARRGGAVDESDTAWRAAIADLEASGAGSLIAPNRAADHGAPDPVGMLRSVLRELAASSFGGTPRGRGLLRLLSTFIPNDVTFVMVEDELTAGQQISNPARPADDRLRAGEVRYLRGFLSGSSSAYGEEILVGLDATAPTLADAERWPGKYLLCVIDEDTAVTRKAEFVRRLVRAGLHAAQAGRFSIGGRAPIEEDIDAWKAGNEACRALGLAESTDRPERGRARDAVSNPAYREFAGW